jgi:hypothetical protein
MSSDYPLRSGRTINSLAVYTANVVVPDSIYNMFGTLRHHAMYNNPLSAFLSTVEAPPLATPLSGPAGARLSGKLGVAPLQDSVQEPIQRS